MTRLEQKRLEQELARFQATVDGLTLRLERTLIALALTYDAQAATQQRLTGRRREHDRFHDIVGDLQTAAEQYRHLARTLTDGSMSRNG